MTSDGYGVCYAMLEGRMNIAISAWRSDASTSADAMHGALTRSLNDMAAMCIAAAAEQPEAKL